MAEQTFNAVERVDEYCHLPEEAAYESSPSTKKAGAGASRSNSSGGAGGGGAGGAAAGAAGKRKPRGKAGAGGLKEPLLPVANTDATAGAGSGVAGSSSMANGVAGSLVVVDGAVPEGWPREGSIEFSDVKMRCV